MLDNQFDEILRNKLEGHVSPVPEDMWQRVRPDNGRKRIALWLWVVFLVACAWGGYFMIKGVSRRPMMQGPGNPAGYAAGTDSGARNGANGGGDAGGGLSGAAANNGGNGANSGGDGTSSGNVGGSGSNGTGGGNERSGNKGRNRGNFGSSGAGEGNERSGNDEASAANDGNWNNGNDNDHANTPAQRLLANTAALQNSAVNDVPAAGLPPQKAALPNRELLIRDSSLHEKWRPPSNWRLDLYGAPNQGIKRPPLSYTAGLRLGRSLGTHFSGAIGLQYLTMYEEVPLDSSTGWLNAIDIPLLIGYETGGPHFKATIQAGGIFNVYSWFKSDQSLPSNDFYRGSTGVSLYLGLNLAEQVSKHFSIFLEPYWRHRLSNKEINNLPGLSQENRAGLSGGIRYYFRKTKQH